MTAFTRRFATATSFVAARTRASPPQKRGPAVKQIDAYNTCYKQSKPRKVAPQPVSTAALFAGGT